jgi:carboxyl-terminal processing protease
MAMGVAGMFVDQSGRQLGTMSTRETNLNFIVIPRAEVYRGPLAILIDGSSASTTEIFAGGMKDLARARLFGTRTAGAALPSIIERLPNGDGFQYAFANYVSAGGQPLEGQGVSPDVEVALSRRALLDGHDPVIDAATAWIQEQRRSGATTTETTGRVDDVPSTVRFTRNEWRTR